MANAAAQRQPVGHREAHHPTARIFNHRVVAAWLFWLVIAANGAGIVWLWAAGGNVSGVHTTGQLLTSLGRLTGLLGSYSLLIQVLLIARLPWIEQIAGFDRLTVWHRLNGKICLYLILAHVGLITVGYAQTDRLSLGSEISTMLQIYPGMVTATVGTVLLVLVAITSLVIVRRRMRYEWWYLVHLLAYAGAVLTWPHQLPTGNEFITNGTAAQYWTGLYLVTLAVLLVFRLVQPLFQTFRHRLHVAEVIPESPTVVSLRITGHRLDRLNARAGQFFLWRFLTRGRWWESHPFSLSAAPNDQFLRISVKTSGDFTRHMAEIRPGTAVIAEGPYGVFTDAVRRRDRVVLIAGGIGITPIRALLEEMPGDLVLIYRVVREEDVIFRDELERLARERGITLHYVVGDHATPAGKSLLSSEHLRRLVPDIAHREAYICGPPAMADLMQQHIRQAGVSRRHVHTERFAL